MKILMALTESQPFSTTGHINNLSATGFIYKSYFMSKQQNFRMSVNTIITHSSIKIKQKLSTATPLEYGMPTMLKQQLKKVCNKFIKNKNFNNLHCPLTWHSIRFITWEKKPTVSSNLGERRLNRTNKQRLKNSQPLGIIKKQIHFCAQPEVLREIRICQQLHKRKSFSNTTELPD